MTQETFVSGLTTTNSYTYDIANRLESVNGVAYTFDANGNLLSDGTNTYTYDAANRLTGFTNGTDSVTYTYSGLGDRLSQTVNGVTTNYTLDLNAGLTQVLEDGTYAYTYGVGRISQQQGTTPEYFLGDALGSVRQLTDQSGAITYARTYDPYGVVITTSGLSQTDYGFTGESYSPSTQLTYLRARYYNPTDGRFQSRDTWGGEVKKPITFIKWTYANSNPLRYLDPSGMITVQQADEANDIIEKLRTKYNVQIEKDWGYRLIPSGALYYSGCKWEEGNWRSLRELRLVKQTVARIAEKLGGESQFKSAMNIIRITRFKGSGQGYESPMSVPPVFSDVWGDLRIPDTFFNQPDSWDRYILAHEIGHRWDFQTNFALSKGLMGALDTWICDNGNNCRWYPYAKHIDPITSDVIWEPPAGVHSGCTGDPPFTKSCPEAYALTYGLSGTQPWEGLSQYYVILPGIEDWAESFANFIYPAYYPSRGWSGLVPDGVRKNYVRKQIDFLQ